MLSVDEAEFLINSANSSPQEVIKSASLMMDDSFCTQTAERYFSSSLDIVHVFPTEIMFLVFDWLDLESLCLCRSVSRTWRKHVNGYLGSFILLRFCSPSVCSDRGWVETYAKKCE